MRLSQSPLFQFYLASKRAGAHKVDTRLCWRSICCSIANCWEAKEEGAQSGRPLELRRRQESADWNLHWARTRACQWAELIFPTPLLSLPSYLFCSALDCGGRKLAPLSRAHAKRKKLVRLIELASHVALAQQASALYPGSASGRWRPNSGTSYSSRCSCSGPHHYKQRGGHRDDHADSHSRCGTSFKSLLFALLLLLTFLR